jgi:DNA-binding transcriptional MerR regulator
VIRLYTINEVATICNVTAHTLRFYDKEGLMPFVGRNNAGNRVFTEHDLNIIKLICCLKNTGMQIKEIKTYIDMFMQGAETIQKRTEILTEHRKEVLRQIEEKKKNLNIIDLKIALYDLNTGDVGNVPIPH